MSAFHDDIRNLNAVLDSLPSGSHAFQLPVLHLVIDHLRLMVRLMAEECPDLSGIPPVNPAAPTPSALAFPCRSGGAHYDQ